MGETGQSTLSDKKVLVPDMNVVVHWPTVVRPISLQFVKEHPGYTVISYVNTTAAVKAASMW